MTEAILDERVIEARIVEALTKLGYPAPKEGMPLLEAFGLVADALEDLAKPDNHYRHVMLAAEMDARLKMEREARGEA